MSRTATAPKWGPEPTNPVPIHMRSIGTLYLAGEAPKEAKLIVRDSGRGSPLTDAELKASIYAKGIIQPLIWKTYQGKDYVVAGNRRLRLLREIFADDLTSAVQTQNVAEFGGDWREIAIDTNLSLPPHLVERYEVIVSLAKDMKLQPADVQARFGMSSRQYNQVMALGRMSELVRQAWKDAEIDAKTAQAFTLEPEPKEQDRIFALLKKNAWRGEVREHDVKSKIVPSNQRETGKLVAFVGVDTVRKAKLIKIEDLFSNDHVVTDIKALNKLAGDKLALKCKELIEAGWAWAVRSDHLQGKSYEYGSIEPSAKDAKATPEEKERLEQLNRLIDGDHDEDQEYDDGKWMDERERIEESIKARGFTPAQRAKAGCFVKIANDGQLLIEYGKVKPSEKKSVASFERTSKPKKPKKPGVVLLTNALAERLSIQLEAAIKASIVSTPDVAVAAIIAGFASSGHVVDVGIGNDTQSRYGHGKNDEKNFAQVFEGAVKATAESRAVMLATVAAAAVSIQIHNAEAKSPIDDAGLQALIAAMDHKLLNKTIAGTFDAKDYFDSVNLQACVDAVRAGMGIAHAEKVAKMKKGEAAKFSAANVPPTGWLPKPLRTMHYTGPTEQLINPVKMPAAKKSAKKKKKAKK